MLKIELHTELIQDTEVNYSSFFYNSEGFLKANNPLEQQHFYAFDPEAKSYRAHIVFSLNDRVAVSPYRAPFGGLSCDPCFDGEALLSFIELCLNELAESGVEEVRIHQAPESYQDNRSIHAAYELLGFVQTEERVYQGIPIDEIPLVEKMVDMQQRRLRKCAKAGFQFKHYSKSELAAAFKQIDRWRSAAQKGLSMTWADLHDSSKRNPKNYHAFAVLDGRVMIAGAIVVVVNEKVLYNFFPASYDAYNSYSPMVMLLNGIYDWGRASGFEHLDLGTSYLGKKVNTGLRTFKERIGGETYLAKSWRKRLN